MNTNNGAIAVEYRVVPMKHIAQMNACTARTWPKSYVNAYANNKPAISIEKKLCISSQ